MKTKYPLRLMISGSSVAELKENAQRFLREVDQTNDVTISQTSDLPEALGAPQQPSTPAPAADSPFGAPPPFPEAQGISGRVFAEHVNVSPSEVAEQVVSSEGLDSRGVPYDKRIHASSATKAKDGSWRRRRGVEDDVFAKVEAELRGVSPVAQAAPTPVPQPLAPAVVHEPYAPVPFTASPAVNPLPAPAPPAPVTLTHSYETFKAQLVGTLAELAKQGLVTQEYIGQLSSHFGVEYLHQVNDEQARQLFDGFVHAGFLKKVN